MQIIPTILTNEKEDVQQKLDLVASESERIETVQIDIIDGVFANNYTIMPEDLIGLDFGELRLDFHLMVNDALDAMWEITDNIQELPVRAVIAQIERLGGPVEYFLDTISKHDLKAGLSFDLYTPLEELTASWFADGLKIIQLMGVETGFGGQKFNELVYEKLQELVQFCEKNHIKTEEIEVMIDGGVNLQVLEQIKALDLPFENIGLAINSAMWKGDFRENYERFNEVATN